jgi:putative SOS response-associated peptidase YedK
VPSANALARTIHDRMPVLIEPKDFGPWLSSEAGTELLPLAPDDTLRLWPVSKRVNRTGNVDDPTLIEQGRSRTRPLCVRFIVYSKRPLCSGTHD